MSPRSMEGSEPLDGELEPLRRSFAALTDETPEPERCPEPDRIWAAVHGQLSAEETEDLIEHTGVCSTCAEEWRLAREVGRLTDEEAGESPREAGVPGRLLGGAHRFRRLVAPLAGLAAAVLLLMVAIPRPSPPPPEFRAGETQAVRSLLTAESPLPRGECLLRWSALDGARYTVLVSDASLAVVAQAEDLESPQFLVPAEALARLPAGADLYWQVEAVLPDGSRETSKTFVSRLE